MISKLTEEKTSALQQSQKLHRELVLFMICIVGYDMHCWYLSFYFCVVSDKHHANHAFDYRVRLPIVLPPFELG